MTEKTKKYKLKQGSPRVEPPGQLALLVDILEFLDKKKKYLLAPIDEQLRIIDEERKKIKAQIRDQCEKAGMTETTQIGDRQLIPYSGRISWNKALLLQLGKEDPRILKAKKEGKGGWMIKKKRGG